MGIREHLRCCFAILMVSLAAQSATLNVTSTTDSTDVTSLRGAIIRANSTGGNTTIVLAESTYKLTIAGSDEDAGLKGDLDIRNGRITILGKSASPVSIVATNLGDRVFQIFTNSQLTLSNIVINGGALTGNNGASGDGESGGAIYNSGTLILYSCVVSNTSSGEGNYRQGNSGGTSGGAGGGIYNAGTMFMSGCSIVRNHSGNGADDAYGGNGGGIYNLGICLLTNCSIGGNRTGDGGSPAGNAFGAGGGGGSGGGIYNAGIMTLKKCTISDNSTGSGASGGQPGIAGMHSPGGFGGSGGDGGGIYNVGNLNLGFSTINNNFSGNGGDGGTFFAGGNPGKGGDGGGIFNADFLTFTNCTISGNGCGLGGHGGSGYNDPGAPGGSGGSGAGIYNAGSSVYESCTVAGNKTGAGGGGGNGATPPVPGGNGGSGGGVFNQPGASVVLLNTLVAMNSVNAGGLAGTNHDGVAGDMGSAGVGRDLDGSFASQGFNLIGVADGSSGLTNGVQADLAGGMTAPLNPLLGPLQNNGGTTSTHALLFGSPAIDQGKSFGLASDQRKQIRPHDYFSISNAMGGDGSDIGAFESDLPILTLTKSATNLVVWWDTNSPGYYVQYTTNFLLPGSWTTISNSAAIVKNQFRMTNHMDTNRKFFRLRSN